MSELAVRAVISFALAALCAGCAPSPTVNNGGGGRAVSGDPGVASAEYEIGPGDQLEIFVWRHSDVSTAVPVRPDGRISTPLVEDMQAAGKTPTELARDIETVLGEYIKNPVVTVIVTGFVGELTNQVRVVGQAAQPRSIPYRQNLTLLDVLIEVGGLTELAAGRRAKVIRRSGTERIEINVRPDVLLDKGDLNANIDMMPGDVLIIPEARF